MNNMKLKTSNTKVVLNCNNIYSFKIIVAF